MAMTSLYAFARVVDDLGDCDATPATRERWLIWWRQTAEQFFTHWSDPDALDRAWRHCVKKEGLPVDPVPLYPRPPLSPGFADLAEPEQPDGLIPHAAAILPAVAEMVSRFQIPQQYLLEIVDGVAADQQKTRFETYEQLEHYCYLVASAVGLACLHIWGFDEPLPSAAAIDCGVAFQLTNILRDIREDAGRGRIYLPRQHYEQHGLCEDDLLQPRDDDRMRCLIRDEADRAMTLFRSGWHVHDHLHEDGKRVFSMMWRTYHQLLVMIRDDPSLVLRTRVRLGFGAKAKLLTQHVVGPLYRRLVVPPYHSDNKPSGPHHDLGSQS